MKLISVKGMCAQLGCGATTAWLLIKENEVTAVRIRARTLITQESIDALIERSTVKTADK